MIKNVSDWEAEMVQRKLLDGQINENNIITALDERFNFKGFMISPVTLFEYDNGAKYAVPAQVFTTNDLGEGLIPFIKEKMIYSDIYPYQLFSELIENKRKFTFRFGEVVREHE
jgi:hypothetical protein